MTMCARRLSSLGWLCARVMGANPTHDTGWRSAEAARSRVIIEKELTERANRRDKTPTDDT